MYANHNPIIAGAMRADPETFIRGAMFAVLSIRQPVIFVPDQMADVSRMGADARCLFGHKRDAYAYLQDHGTRLWRAMFAARTPREAVAPMLAVPGLGIVKSAFVAQLAGHDVGCLDSRNLRRLGMAPRAFETRGEKSGRKVSPRVLDAYMDAAEGRSQELWDDWCADVAPRWKMTPEEISALHLVISE